MPNADEDNNNAKFLKLKASGRVFYKNKEYRQALEKFEEAYQISQKESLKERIDKLKEYLDSESSSSEDNSSGSEDDGSESLALVAEGFQLSKSLYDKLYQYQKEGLQWMWGLHQRGKGGILADDMGLGKTVQIISFLTGLMDSGQIKSALIVMPVSLIQNWEAEIATWAPGLRHRRYHGSSSTLKERNLRAIQNRGGILFTSYGMIVSSGGVLSKRPNDTKFNWDYIILDEGHKIKNPTKTTKSIHEFMAAHRLVLTGTPVQNNLKELWALYDFCHQGALLGTLTTFKAKYETPINRSREKDATPGEKNLGSKIAENLRNLIAPYFIRRTKADTMKSITDLEARSGKSCASLPKKNELIVWVHLSQQQIDIYQQFLESDVVREILTKNRRNPLVYLVAMKKICDHPRLFSVRARSQLRGQINLDESDDEVEVPNDPVADHVSLNVDPYLLLKESGKMEVLIKLLENLKKEGHRTLVFSLSRKILDIIQKILLTGNWNVLRLDGTIRNLDERQRRINLFQNSTEHSVFLLTTQVGGVGLNLTAADRVVIYDPSWNPATDAQAVDRAYRIGQTKDVVVYRLITCGAIEEKIYRRQIFKDSITRQATCKGETDKDPHRYFTKSELRELFVLDDPMSSNTQIQLTKIHEHLKNTTPQLDRHIGHLEAMRGHIFGISHHDLMFHGNLQDDSDDSGVHEDERIIQEVYIQQQVRDAQQRLQLESEKHEIQTKFRGAYKTTYFEEAQAEDPFYALPGHDDEFYDNALTIDVALFDHDEEDAFMEDIKIPEIISQLAFPDKTVAEFSPASSSSAHLKLNIPQLEDTECSSSSTQTSTTQPDLPQNDDDDSSTDSSQSSIKSGKNLTVNKMQEADKNVMANQSQGASKTFISNQSQVSSKIDTSNQSVRAHKSLMSTQSSFKFGVPKKYTRTRKIVVQNVGPTCFAKSTPVRKASNAQNRFDGSPIEPTNPAASLIISSSNQPMENYIVKENSLVSPSTSRDTSCVDAIFPSTIFTSPILALTPSTPQFSTLGDISGDSGVNEASSVTSKLEKKLKREKKRSVMKDKVIAELSKNQDHLKSQLTLTHTNLVKITKEALRWKKLLEEKEACIRRLSSTRFGGIDDAEPVVIRSEPRDQSDETYTEIPLISTSDDIEIDLDQELELLKQSLSSTPDNKGNSINHKLNRDIKSEKKNFFTSETKKVIGFNFNSIKKENIFIKSEQIDIDSNFVDAKDSATSNFFLKLDSDDDDLPIIMLDSTPSTSFKRTSKDVKDEKRAISPTIELLDNCLNSIKSGDKLMHKYSNSNNYCSFFEKIEKTNKVKKQKRNCALSDTDLMSQFPSLKPKVQNIGNLPIFDFMAKSSQSCDESIVETLRKSRGEKKPPKSVSNLARVTPNSPIYLESMRILSQTQPKSMASCDDVMMASLRKSREDMNKQATAIFPTMKFSSSRPMTNPVIISLHSQEISSASTLNLTKTPEKPVVHDDFFANILKSKLDKERNASQGLPLKKTKPADDHDTPKLDAETLFNQLREEESVSTKEYELKVNEISNDGFDHLFNQIDENEKSLAPQYLETDDSNDSFPKASSKIDTESLFNSLLNSGKLEEKSPDANNFDDSTDSEPPSFFQSVKEKYKDLFTFDYEKV